MLKNKKHKNAIRKTIIIKIFHACLLLLLLKINGIGPIKIIPPPLIFPLNLLIAKMKPVIAMLNPIKIKIKPNSKILISIIFISFLYKIKPLDKFLFKFFDGSLKQYN